MATFMNHWNTLPLYKREAALLRTKRIISDDINSRIIEDYNSQKNYFNEEFESIMKLKAKWDLGEISKDEFQKWTKEHVMNCWAFKYINKVKHINATKIQALWRGYKIRCENRIIETEEEYSNDWDERSSDLDELEHTYYF